MILCDLYGDHPQWYPAIFISLSFIDSGPGSSDVSVTPLPLLHYLLPTALNLGNLVPFRYCH